MPLALPGRLHLERTSGRETRHPAFPSILSQARSECGIGTEKRPNTLKNAESIKERGNLVGTIDGNQSVYRIQWETGFKASRLAKLGIRRFVGIFPFAPVCTCKSSPFFFFFTFSSYLRTLASPPSPLPPPPVELPTGGGTTEVRLSSQTPRRASHSPFPGETSASQAVAVQLSPSEAPTRPPCFFALPPPPGRALYPNSVKSSAAAAAVQHRAVRVGGGAQQGFPTASCSSQSKPLNH